jgi:diguanylate cyclase (GGDEF)-like protein
LRKLHNVAEGVMYARVLYAPGEGSQRPMRRSSLIRLAALALASLPGGKAPCLEAIPLGSGGGMIDVTTRAEYFVDDSGSMTVEEAAKGDFSASRPGLAGKGGALWTRFRLQGRAASPSEPDSAWILGVMPVFSLFLDEVDLYVPRSGGGFEEISSGATAATRPSEPASRDFLFPLPSAALGGEVVYLRLRGDRGTDAGIAVRGALETMRKDTLYYAAYGVFYGILLAFIVYNFFLFASLRDRAYLYYVLYVFAGIVWQFWIQGQAKTFLGAIPALDMRIMWVGLGSMIFWGAAFASAFLGLRASGSHLSLAFDASAAAGGAVIATGVVGWNAAAAVLAYAMGIALPLLVVAASIYRFARGNKPALYLAVAWAALAAGAVSFSLMGLKALGASFWTVHGVAFGMAIEAVLLSMALAERVRRLSMERSQFQRMQDRYLELSITDELTGLYNRRYLLSRLQSEAEHAQRLDRPLCLLFLDLDDFKAVNDTFGHASGDLVLRELASEIRSSLREGDVACRFGGEEFAIVMPGIRLRDAAIAAERLRSGFEDRQKRGVDGDPIRITISLGVVEASAGEGPDAIIARADKAMYRAKERGKNRVEQDDGA